MVAAELCPLLIERRKWTREVQDATETEARRIRLRTDVREWAMRLTPADAQRRVQQTANRQTRLQRGRGRPVPRFRRGGAVQTLSARTPPPPGEELESELAHARAGEPPAQPAPVVAPFAPAYTAPEPSRAANDDANTRAARVLARAGHRRSRHLHGARRVGDPSRRCAQPAPTPSSLMPDQGRCDPGRRAQRSEAILADAQTRSETQLRQAAERAEAMESDAQRKHSEFQAMFSQQRNLLEDASSSSRLTSASTAPVSRPTSSRSWKSSTSAAVLLRSTAAVRPSPIPGYPVPEHG